MSAEERGGWDTLREIQREMGRLLESFQPFHSWRFGRPFPPVNLYDAGDRYVLTAELPGLTTGDVELALTGETLTLRGERRPDESIPDEAYRRQERPLGAWSRAFTLPTSIRSDAVAATLARGVLVVELPKAEDVPPRQIVVTATPD